MENLAKLVETIVINKLASLPIEKRAMNWLGILGKFDKRQLGKLLGMFGGLAGVAGLGLAGRYAGDWMARKVQEENWRRFVDQIQRTASERANQAASEAERITQQLRQSREHFERNYPPIPMPSGPTGPVGPEPLIKFE
jgi:alkylated DNA nucleotide flippase Atl1